MSVAGNLIRSARFRAEREPDWRALEIVLAKAERHGVGALSFEEAHALGTLYRKAMASLSTAREISLDRALLAYLEALCARAYLAVYAPQQRLGGLLGRLLGTGIPGAARRLWPLILAAYAILILGAVVGYMLFLADPLWYQTVMPADLAGGRGLNASREDLLAVIYSGEGSASDQLMAFASTLFSRNTQIAILVFSLGVLACIPAAALTFFNGMVLGVFLALHADRGILGDVLAWLAIHGITELSAIAIACAGGLHLGQAVLFPGEIRRRDALRRNARDAVKLAILAGMMLVAAAILEGFGRQLVQSPGARIAIGIAAGLFWLAWLALSGRRTR
ncbi:stage II sporulation protein M [Halovulum dunhuangense]|uniref:Stage II sporulation protein M n=1 Tax=Halovulum dunhuangense TaxID=1505036 RepID=A0A849L590_9RHOB|nr:stage II sporulation protein M [Halovulum dunhuangense]NNU81526.1 stage II sporulation protein M [Halovulum dunhuangense]